MTCLIDAIQSSQVGVRTVLKQKSCDIVLSLKKRASARSICLPRILLTAFLCLFVQPELSCTWAWHE